MSLASQKPFATRFIAINQLSAMETKKKIAIKNETAERQVLPLSDRHNYRPESETESDCWVEISLLDRDLDLDVSIMLAPVCTPPNWLVNQIGSSYLPQHVS